MNRTEAMRAVGTEVNTNHGDLAYLNDPDVAEALAWGYGVPPPHVLGDLRALWWRWRRADVILPTERRVILISGDFR